MANCKFCGKDAGILRSAHKECIKANEQGKQQILQLISEKATHDVSSAIKDTVMAIAGSSFIDSQSLKEILIRGWENAAAKALDDDVLTADEEYSLQTVSTLFELDQDSLDKNGLFGKVAKNAIIRELLEGKIPQRMKFIGDLPFNLKKDEQLVWVFQGVDYYEERTSTQYQGGYAGISVRVMKGLYFRTGAFRGNPVSTSQMMLRDRGKLGITSRNIYFSGSSQAFRVPYSKIVAFRPYSDGLGIQRDAQSARPQIFIVDDGWFVHNLVRNLAELDKV